MRVYVFIYACSRVSIDVYVCVRRIQFNRLPMACNWWLVELMYVWLYVQVGWVDGWMDGWMDEFSNGWIDGWVWKGWVICSFEWSMTCQ